MGNVVVLSGANKALQRGTELQNQGRLEEARSEYIHCIQLYEQVAPRSFGLAMAYSYYAALLSDQTFYEDAMRYAEKGLKILTECSPGSRETASLYALLAALCTRLQKWEECIRASEMAISIFDKLQENAVDAPVKDNLRSMRQWALLMQPAQENNTQTTTHGAPTSEDGKETEAAPSAEEVAAPSSSSANNASSASLIEGRQPPLGSGNDTDVTAHPSQTGLGNHNGVLSLLDTRRLLEGQGYQVAPSKTIPDNVLEQLGSRQPFDIFLVHAGTEKRNYVSSMKDIFQSKGLECFLDADMEGNNGSPVEQMTFALETCRHAVVVLSKAFLEQSRHHPRQELGYAFDRMLWIRENGPWESMWVVLFDLSVSEYKTARETLKKKNVILPPLHTKKVLFEWSEGTGSFTDWPHICHVVKAAILKEDEKGALQRWQELLKDIPSDFPSPDDLYPDSSPCTNFFSSHFGFWS